MSERIPRDARDLIVRHIHSVAQLETLLYVRARAEHAVTADLVAREQKIAREMATDILTDLTGRGFLKEAEDGYVYGPNDELVRGVDSLAETYGTYRVAIINLIFSKPSEGVQSFADAFRFRKTED